MIPSPLAELAECPDAISEPPPGFERVLTDRYSLLLGPMSRFTSVQRVRCGEDDVEETVAEVRAHVRGHGHREAMWWLGASSTPPDLYERLLAAGLRPPETRFRELKAMATATAPHPGPADVEARPVASFEELLEATHVRWGAFAPPPEKREEELAQIEERYRIDREVGTVVTYIALLDGRPAGNAVGVFSPAGCLLVGGATAEWARHRGVYRSLVRARWDEAVRRGTPGLAVQAAPASEPILRGLGFDEVCTLRRLEDPET